MTSMMELHDTLTPERRALLALRLWQKNGQAISPIEPGRRALNPAALSQGQRSIWLRHQLGDDLALSYKMAFRLRGPLGVEGLRWSMEQVVRRHEILRTRFVLHNQNPVQEVLSPVPWELVAEDVSGDADQILRREEPRPFHLEEGEVLRTRLFRMGPDDHLFIVFLHHIAVDGWSSGILSRELSVFYAAWRGGVKPSLPPLEIQYADYATWQNELANEEKLRQLEEFWKHQLDGALPLVLATDFPRPSRLKYVGARESVVIGADLTARIRALSREAEASMFMTLLAAWQAVLSLWSDQKDFVVATFVADRRAPKTQDMIGFFVNTVLLRVNLSGNPAFSELLARVKKTALSAYSHQELPVEYLLDKVQKRFDVHPANPLLQNVFGLQTVPPPLTLAGLDVVPVTIPEHTVGGEILLQVYDTGREMTAVLEYSSELWRPATAKHLTQSFLRAMESIVENPQRRISRLLRISERERRLLVDKQERTGRNYPQKTVIELFEEQVERYPGAIAVLATDCHISYRSLSEQANRFARYLVRSGVRRGHIVAICVGRGPEMLIVILGVLKAGAAYLPLHPDSPAARTDFMLRRAGARLIVAERGIAGHLDEASFKIVWWDDFENQDVRCDLPAALPCADLSALAYVIYTSGSTGEPKGVMVSHFSLANAMHAFVDLLEMGPEDGSMALTALSFDIAGLELFVPLVSGGRVIVVPEAVRSNGSLLGEFVTKAAPTLIQATPSTFEILRAAGWQASSGVRVLSGGEALQSPLAEHLIAGGSKLWNMYGPTETTIWSTAARLSKVDHGFIPIGSPIANTQVYVMDETGEPIQEGRVGEIVIGGAGLAWGYINQASSTAAAFIPDGLSGCIGGRLYKTGDFGRWNAEGELEFIGRRDTQVKIRGHRIELGEIETVLKRQPTIATCAVIVQHKNTEEGRLIAYVVPREGALPAWAQLRVVLANDLPPYMVPNIFVPLTEMPLLPSGKIDRRALKYEDTATSQRPLYVEPKTEMEEQIAQAWVELLAVERVGREDHFFELGGQSLVAMRLIARVRETVGVEVTIADLFARPMLADFAAFLSQAPKSNLPVIAGGQPRTKVPPSFAQQRLWFLSQMDGTSQLYNIALSLRLSGRLNRAALRHALDGVVARHEALRTVFHLVEGHLVQSICAAKDSCFHLLEHDLTNREDEEAETHHLMVVEARQGFDLEAGPLARGRLIQQDKERHLLLITMHHIISDGWSIGILLREIKVLYGAFLRGESDPLPKLTVQYADYAFWQRKWMAGEMLEQQADYWKKTLTGAPELLALACDHARPQRQSFAGALARMELDAELTANLRSLSLRHGVTLFMSLVAAWAVLLARLSGQDDLLIGTPVANRSRMEIENLIGCFVNTVVLRVNTSGAPTVATLLERVKGQVIAAQRHQEIPFEQVVEIVNPVRTLGHSPLFQVMFAWQDASNETLELPGLKVVQKEPETHVVSKFDLTMMLQGAGDRVEGVLEYDTALFERSTIDRYLGYYRSLLQGMAAGESQTVDQLPMISEKERQLIVYEWNRIQPEYPGAKCLHELFEQQVDRRPDATAVEYEKDSVSYFALNRRANQLAHSLQKRGVGPEVRVGICLERSLEMIVAVMGVLKAGGAYVPLDPGYPQERLQFMVQDSQAAILITQRSLEKRFPPNQTGLLCWEEISEELSHGSCGQVQSGVGADNLAYLIYTSGSTGQPKGAMVTHGNVVRLLHATEGWFEFNEEDVWTMFHSYAFDFSVWEIWGALAYGGRLVVVPYWVSRNTEAFYTLVKQSGVTVLNQTPSAFHQFSREDETSKAGEDLNLRLVIFGGETLEMSRLRPWMDRHGVQSPQMVNMYGITETTVHVTYQVLTKELANGKASVIGQKIPDLQLYILRDMEPVPIGVVGEIYVGGAGLARGYWRRTGLTAEKFVPNPFSQQEGARLYRTGDLGRYSRDGNIEYLGRVDQQVKIRGFRIELGEIEARLRECEGVSEGVIMPLELVPGEQRLVAYYVLQAGILSRDAPDAKVLREYLSKTLPDYMVPAEFVRLEQMPLTENGKLDRKALPLPDSNARGESEYEAPLGELETAIARIWADELQLERVSRHDNFFELGGHSLSAVRLVGRIRQELQTDVSVRQLFEAPRVSALAKRLQANGKRSDPWLDPIVAVPRTDEVPLSYGQHQLWVVQQLNPSSTAYHIPSLFHLHGNLNTEILERSFSEIVRRHEILRTSFPTRLGRPVQCVEAPHRLLFPLIDVSSLASNERALALERLIGQDGKQPFNFAGGPLIRFLLVRLARDQHALLITFHHIVADGWSIPILVRELTVIYSALLEGKPNPLADLPIQYADYAWWLINQRRSAAFARSLHYWRDQLAEIPVLQLPCDDGKGEMPAEGAVRESLVPAEVLQGLHKLSEREGCTLFMTLLACWQILLARYCNQTDIVVGAPVANRPTPDLYGLIGYFVNTVVLRTDLSGDPSLNEVLQRVRTVVLDAHTHEQVPFEYLVAELKPPREPGQTPFFRAVFTFSNFEVVPYALPQLRIETQAVEQFAAKFDLELSAVDHHGRIDLRLIYKPHLLSQEFIERMINDYLAILGKMVQGTSSSIWQVTLCGPAVQSSLIQKGSGSLPPQGETQVQQTTGPVAVHHPGAQKRGELEGSVAADLAAFNRTETAYDSKCFHELFEEQVTRTPQGVAVVFEDERITYQELNERSNQLAHYLRAKGVGPENWVGLSLNRSIDLVVAMLGILKAGAGYVPLDPGYPQERLAYMLRDSAPALLVGRGHALESVEVFDPVARRNVLKAYSTRNLEHLADLLNPAVLIYTSGSTGQPKGVALSHAALTNHMQWMTETFCISNRDRVLQKAPISFDASISELCLPLMTGATLVLAKPGGQQDSRYLVNLIIDQNITVAQFVPSLLEFVVREKNFDKCITLKWVLTGAEPLPRTLATKVHDALGLDIMNLYGPTETTIDAIACQVKPGHERVMVGKPIGNMRAYVLSVEGQPMPVGEAGEIYIGGVQLARGYWAKPQLTAEQFLPDAVSGRQGERLYRTGDMGRWGTDGQLECLGRCDDQVKVRGCRVEKGEIENLLRRYAGVVQAAVRLWRDADGQSHLIAYIVGASTELTARQVRRDLANSLPDYMLPSHILFLEAAPLTPSGKLDTQSLPLPQQSDSASSTAVFDHSIESIVLSTWKQVLVNEDIELDDNFFEAGGNSFLLLQTREKLCEQLATHIGVPDMLRFATVRSLSEALRTELETNSLVQ